MDTLCGTKVKLSVGGGDAVHTLDEEAVRALAAHLGRQGVCTNADATGVLVDLHHLLRLSLGNGEGEEGQAGQDDDDPPF